MKRDCASLAPRPRPGGRPPSLGKPEARRPRRRFCGACRKRTYCSRYCQTEDWNAGHRDLCVEAARLAITSTFEAALETDASSAEIHQQLTDAVKRAEEVKANRQAAEGM